MGSYVKKRREIAKESRYDYVYGTSSTKFDGEYRHRINKDLEYFTNDYIETISEDGSNGYKEKIIGIKKIIWKFNGDFRR